MEPLQIVGRTDQVLFQGDFLEPAQRELLEAHDLLDEG
jgi:hypothetical protein